MGSVYHKQALQWFNQPNIMHIMDGRYGLLSQLGKSPTFHHQVASTGRDGLREALKLGRKEEVNYDLSPLGEIRNFPDFFAGGLFHAFSSSPQLEPGSSIFMCRPSCRLTPKKVSKDCEHSGLGASDLGLGGDPGGGFVFLFGKLIFSPQIHL